MIMQLYDLTPYSSNKVLIPNSDVNISNKIYMYICIVYIYVYIVIDNCFYMFRCASLCYEAPLHWSSFLIVSLENARGQIKQRMSYDCMHGILVETRESMWGDKQKYCSCFRRHVSQDIWIWYIKFGDICQ